MAEQPLPTLSPCVDVKLKCSGAPSYNSARETLLQNEGRPANLEIETVRPLHPEELTTVSLAASSVRRLILDTSCCWLAPTLFGQLLFRFAHLREFEYRVDGDTRMAISRTLDDVLKYWTLPPVTRYGEEILWESWRFQNITSLTMTHMERGVCPSYPRLWQMLCQCSDTLVYFEYQGYCPAYPGPSPVHQEPRMLYPFCRLETLKLGIVDDILPLAKLFAGRALFLKHLIIRNLIYAPETFIERHYQETQEQMTTTSSLFSAFLWWDGPRIRFSFPQLESLHLIGIDDGCDTDIIDAFIHGSPVLRSVTLFAICGVEAEPRSPIYDSFFEHEDDNPKYDIPPSFPNLEELTVSHGHYAVRRWLKRRLLARYPPLKKLVITTSCYTAYEDKVKDPLTSILVWTVKDAVVISDPVMKEYTDSTMERVLVKDGNELETYVSESVVKILVGNKVDKEFSRQVPTAEAQAFAERMSSLFIETSAKTSVNVKEAFQEVVERILDTPELWEGAAGAKCIARANQRIAITQLETLTIAFAAMNFAIYALWWRLLWRHRRRSCSTKQTKSQEGAIEGVFSRSWSCHNNWIPSRCRLPRFPMRSSALQMTGFSVCCFLLTACAAPRPSKDYGEAAGVIADYESTIFCRDTGDDSDDKRPIQDIVWSCLATIFACTWVSIHPNIPPIDEGLVKRFLRRVGITLLALIAPELVVIWALRQWLVSRQLAKEYADLSWEQVHGFFALMGGFMFYDKHGRPRHVLYPQRLRLFRNRSELEVTAREIWDRSKGDGLSKSLAVLQTTWFILQCIARAYQRVAITQLETLTVAFAAMNLVIYALWWNKPLGVERPIRVASDGSESGILRSDAFKQRTTSHYWGPLRWVYYGLGLHLVERIILGTDDSGFPAVDNDDMIPRIFGPDPRAFTSEVSTTCHPRDLHVPMFYTGWLSPRPPPREGRKHFALFTDSPPLFVAPVAVGFGAIHCIAWHSVFSTDLEQRLWHVSTIVIIAAPVLPLAVLHIVWLFCADVGFYVSSSTCHALPLISTALRDIITTGHLQIVASYLPHVIPTMADNTINVHREVAGVNCNCQSIVLSRDSGDDSDDKRSIQDIVWSCLATIFACTWVSIHPNIPPLSEGHIKRFFRRVGITALALIAPELIVIWALRQWKSSRQIAREHADLGWKQVHGFFAIMGGFMIYDEHGPLRVLYPHRLSMFRQSPTLRISAEEIWDRSKGDVLAKGLVVFQTMWFILQCIARKFQGLAITQLEALTIAFAVLNFVIYALWWNKPLGVEHPVHVASAESPDQEFLRLPTFQQDTPRAYRRLASRPFWLLARLIQGGADDDAISTKDSDLISRSIEFRPGSWLESTSQTTPLSNLSTLH
ncbi:hypothetical protein D9758_011042 [Tetrapyrgos nigripes]|uniref:Uncharacterized protein n=1 Tax=Tetrapyrgos nigripes TaxID=182062 RepID=A0A8H5FS75_9AGAR|nr:hypothetical protein D9758_011042 [Tetrapyrgos nigripes]